MTLERQIAAARAATRCRASSTRAQEELNALRGGSAAQAELAAPRREGGARARVQPDRPRAPDPGAARAAARMESRRGLPLGAEESRRRAAHRGQSPTSPRCRRHPCRRRRRSWCRRSSAWCTRRSRCRWRHPSARWSMKEDRHVDDDDHRPRDGGARRQRAQRDAAREHGAVRRAARAISAPFGAILRRPISALSSRSRTRRSSRARVARAELEISARRVIAPPRTRSRGCDQIVQDNRDLDELRVLNLQLRQGMIQYQQLVEKMTASVDGSPSAAATATATATPTERRTRRPTPPTAPAGAGAKPAPAPPVAAPHKRSIEATIPPLNSTSAATRRTGGATGSRRRATARPGSRWARRSRRTSTRSTRSLDRRGPRHRARAREQLGGVPEG